MKVFVTGATGFLGRHLTEVLLANHCEVTALVRTFDRARELPPGVRPVAGDITRPDKLRAAMRGAELIFHLAAWVGQGARPKDYPRLARINVEGTRSLLELAGELGGPPVIITSTLEVFGDTHGRLVTEAELPATPPLESEYARSKYRALVEVVAPFQARGLPVTVVCPGQLYGEGDLSPTGQLLRRYALRRLPALLGPQTAFCWTHAADAAQGHWLAAQAGRPGQTYLLAGPALSYSELFARAQAASGLPEPALYLPASLARLMAGAARRINPRLAESLARFSGVTFLASADKARSELGWQPRAVEAGLPPVIEWYQARDREALEAARHRPSPSIE